MYLDHFGLTSRPFINSPGEGFFSPNEDYESAVSRMEQVLQSRDAVAIVSGGPGVGKTTLVSTAAGRVGDQALVTYVDMRLMQPELLFDLLLMKLGGESGNGDLATSLYRLKSVISQHNDEQGRKITAVIDVSNLTIERAKRIMQLIHMTGDPDGQLNIVLLGPHALHKLLDTPGLIHIRQRVTFRYRIRPLSVPETEQYMQTQVEQAGGQGEAVLSHGTSIMVFKYVGGVPRLINTLMDAALSTGARQGLETITPELITEVAQLLGWRRLSSDRKAPAKKQAAAVAAPKTRTKPAEDAASQLEVMAKSESETAAPAESGPIGESTAMLMAAALNSDNEPDQAETEAAKGAETRGSSVPEMSADDTSATGMLRLEDLDARFAETVFGDDFKKAATEAQD